MKRRPTTQDLSWFLDLNRNNQLDLDPPYQRRSIWTLKDRKFFLDTIFRDYPCPAVFLHKEINETGKLIYHVVDGKQRLETIIQFVNNQISIDKNFGDNRLNGKKWKNLEGETDFRTQFWNYVLSVEFLDTTEGGIVNDVFDRLNRNSRKLERQELRHAKFDGWLINIAETEAEKELWEELGVVTKASIKRMKNVQFISELLIIILKERIDGFDQDYIDSIYAEYESLEESPNFSEENFHKMLNDARMYVADLEKQGAVISTYAKGSSNFYSLWGLIILNKNKLPDSKNFSEKYSDFMKKVDTLGREKDPEKFLKEAAGDDSFSKAYNYFRHSVGASTDLSQREVRHQVLESVLLN